MISLDIGLEKVAEVVDLERVERVINWGMEPEERESGMLAVSEG